MSMTLNASSKSKLWKVHPDLVRVVQRCALDWPDKDTGFIVTCGVRTLEEQKILKAKGASKTLRSRHIPAENGLAHAVDLAFAIHGAVKWDFPLYTVLAKRMKAAARTERVPIEWGGDWKSFRDGPHFQLPWAKYPGTIKGAKK